MRAVVVVMGLVLATVVNAERFPRDPSLYATHYGNTVVVRGYDEQADFRPVEYTYAVSSKFKVTDADLYFDVFMGIYRVAVTLGDKSLLTIPEGVFESAGLHSPVLGAKAVVSTIAVSNDASAFAVACDGATAVAVGSSSATPVSLIDLAAGREVAAAVYPSKLARSVAVDDEGKQALAVIDEAIVSTGGAVRRLAIASGTITDTGEQLTFGGEYVARVFIAPGGKIGVAVVGGGSTRLVAFAVPGLVSKGSRSFNNVVNAVAFSPLGDRIFVRRGQRDASDSIEAYAFDPSTGAIGATALWSTKAISGFTGTGFQTSMAIARDGTSLVVADENIGNALAAPRIARLDPASGAITTSDTLPAGAAPQVIATQRSCKSAPQAAVEYHHAAFDHYFVTSIAEEIGKLDNGTFAGWTRTGKQFNVYPSDAAGTVSTCRFFSTSFGLKSSHFYATSASECATVQANPSWQIEGNVFATYAPAADGSCATGTVPLYRMYNNGSGGAPNHRYTTQADVRTQMIGQGWIPEGLGVGVVACVPP